MKRLSPISPPRRDDGTLLPAALLALLVGLVVVQLALTGEPALPPAGVGRVAPLDAAIARPQPAPAAPIILARPLFSPTRGPGGGGLGGASAAPMGGAVPVGVIGRGRVRILFLKAPDGRVHRIVPGGAYEGWRLLAVDGEAATFMRGGERVRVAYGSQAVAPAAQSPDADEADGEEDSE